VCIQEDQSTEVAFARLPNPTHSVWFKGNAIYALTKQPLRECNDLRDKILDRMKALSHPALPKQISLH